MATRSARRRWILPVVVAVGVVSIVLWIASRIRGPALPGYEVVAAPVVQDVVATGRVAAPSRVRVGAE
ncbi:hypothetical protein, partial [Cognatilysobacter lacus]